MKLFVATHNQHKIREISQILPGFEIVPDDPEGVEENAPDFAGNALIKVRAIAEKHKLGVASLKAFINDIVERKIFDGEKLNELLEPLNMGWRDRTRKENDLMMDLAPLLKRLLPGQEISGLSAYDD